MLIVPTFTDWTAVDLRHRRRLHAEPGRVVWLDDHLLALPELETVAEDAGLRLTAIGQSHMLRLNLTPHGRPTSWAWLRLGGSADFCGHRVCYRAAVFDHGDRLPSRLVLDIQ